MSYEKITAANNGSFSDGVLRRRAAEFPPSPWGDYFLSSHFNNQLVEDNVVEKQQFQEVKEEVRSMFAAVENSSERLSLIDSIQRLGLSHHFQEEINEVVLEHIEKFRKDNDNDADENLYIIALQFRMLRQQGYYVSCEIFNKFTNERGEFKESIANDEVGLLSLYEASHLRTKGENILDEALAFTTTHLKAMAMDSNSPFFEEAKYALKWPIYKAVPRFMARQYISLCHKNPLKTNNVLLTFAKLDYNSLQKLYQKELGEFSRWWKEHKLKEQLPFARVRVVEIYVWALGVQYEPKYCNTRRILAKIITFISVLDDMYDVYATLDELQLFTNAIQRWDVSCIEKLPNYMKGLYETILEVYEEIEKDICKDNNIPFAFDYAKEALKSLCKAYFMEAKWFNEGYIPTVEEYMKVARISASYNVFASISFLTLGNVASKEFYEWAQTDPILLKAAGVIGRLLNDMVSHKFEQERGHVASAVECYVKEYEVSEEEALIELEKEVGTAWKDVTEDYTKSSLKFPNVILECVLNVARLSDFFYKEVDGYTFADGETKHFIDLMLTHPVLV
ncbi:hypothetical protein IC582_014780 [Cucumis melo]|uniref:(-)-germacrene D synthase-like n=1 Tax=Cucumis melo TaxID=3656 RepID=A0A1S4DXZ8_CUCME|nr:(-)-germacrene D synthase-like [Cucumis melo]